MPAGVTKAVPGSGTTQPGSDTWLSSDLPTDLLQAASRRLVVFMYSVAAVYAIYLALFVLVLSAHARRSAQINALIVIAVCCCSRSTCGGPTRTGAR